MWVLHIANRRVACFPYQRCESNSGSATSSPAQPLEGKPSSEASEDWVQLRNPDGRIFHHNPTTGALLAC